MGLLTYLRSSYLPDSGSLVTAFLNSFDNLAFEVRLKPECSSRNELCIILYVFRLCKSEEIGIINGVEQLNQYLYFVPLRLTTRCATWL